jgi:hypothetical protein
MYVTFEHRDCITDETRELIRATRGAAVALARVHVHLSSSIKFPFTREKRCWVELTLSDSSVIIGAAQGLAWRSAIDLAMARACLLLPGSYGAKERLHASSAARTLHRW